MSLQNPDDDKMMKALIPPGLNAVNSAKLRFFTRGKACHKRGKNAQSGIQIGRKLT